MRPTAVNRLVRALYTPAYRKFLAPRDVRRVQMDYLCETLHRNAASVYGRKYRFSEIAGYRDFAQAVPLTTYEDYAPYIEQIAHGVKGVLTSEPVLLFEPTSGSSGARKLIPYTASLKREFQAGIRPWLGDLYTRIPGICEGKSYWSISPVTHGKEYTPGGIPIGFEEDASYFGIAEGALMRKIFAVDGRVKFYRSMDKFWHDTASALLTCGDLTLISVWNPTYLTLLCDYIREHARALTLELPTSWNRLYYARVNRFDRVFPALRVISCWADGSAADELLPVEYAFPDVQIQPKGLLSTECFTSLPLCDEIGSRLCIDAHFFEFRRASDGKIFTADRLTPDIYEVIVTTGGGFYRYCTGDLVEILAVYPDHPPRLRFLRRRGITSDLCGEKLTEDFVAGVCRKLGIAEAFCLLAPEGLGYTLYTTADITPAALDAALCESYHYRYCRDLGQLRCAEVFRVGGDPKAAYLDRLTAEGMRLGDIKPAHLSRKSGWKGYFRGMF